MLIVDDDASIRALLQRFLTEKGFDVVVAENGFRAIEIYEIDAGGFSLVLMDVQMPGMDGLKTLRELRKLDEGVRCCFMSGDLGDRTLDELEESKALHLFQKPFVLNDMLAMMRQLTSKLE